MDMAMAWCFYKDNSINTVKNNTYVRGCKKLLKLRVRVSVPIKGVLF